MPACHAGGREFKSRQHRSSNKAPSFLGAFPFFFFHDFQWYQAEEFGYVDVRQVG